MADVIVMSAAEAEQAKVGVPPFHYIMPVPLSDGRFFVGVEILDDPVYAEWNPQFAAFAATHTVPYEDIVPLLMDGPPPSQQGAR